MTTEAVKLAKLQARRDREANAWKLAQSVVENPIAVGFGALAVNYAAFKAGAYKNAPVRSALGGPVWFTIGDALEPDVEQYARYEAFIMTVTAALALSGSIRNLSSPIASLSNLLKGVSS